MADLIVNGFNVGTELTQVILHGDDGSSVDASSLGHLIDISADQQVTQLTSTPVLYGGKRLHRNVYHDWSGRMNFERFSGALTAKILRIMERFQDTGAESYFTLYCTINNTTIGSIDEYAFQQCVLDGAGFGSFSGTANVNQPLSFRCQKLLIAAGN